MTQVQSYSEAGMENHAAGIAEQLVGYYRKMQELDRDSSQNEKNYAEVMKLISSFPEGPPKTDLLGIFERMKPASCKNALDIRTQMLIDEIRAIQPDFGRRDQSDDVRDPRVYKYSYGC